MESQGLDLATVLDTVDDDVSALTALRDSQMRVRREEALQIALAARFASFHEVDHWRHAAAGADEVPHGEGDLLLGGDGCPWVSEFCVTEFAAATGRSTQAARTVLSAALALTHRLPATWAAVRAGRVDGWRARRIAEATLTVSRQAAAWVDTQVAPRAQTVGVATLGRLVEEAIARCDPEQVLEDEADELAQRHVTMHKNLDGSAVTMEFSARVDTDDALALDVVLDDIADQLDPTLPKEVRRARAIGMLARGEIVFNHPTPTEDAPVAVGSPELQMIVRVAEGDTLATVHSLTGQRLGMVSVNQLQMWAGHSKMVVKPVLDLNIEAASGGRFPSQTVRDQVIETNRHCVFPYCERPAEACDADHIEEWSETGPPDQTRTGNLAPLCRHHHRVKTHTSWRYRQTAPGVHEWTSPHGLTFRVDRDGTTDTSDPGARSGVG